MKALIKLHDLDKETARTISHESECNNSVELSAFRSCVELGEVITMGTTIAEPVKPE